MTNEAIQRIANKAFNTPILLNRYPMIDKVVVHDVVPRLSHKGSYIMDAHIYLKDDYKEYSDEQKPFYTDFIDDKIASILKDILSSLGIGGSHNYVYTYIKKNVED